MLDYIIVTLLNASTLAEILYSSVKGGKKRFLID